MKHVKGPDFPTGAIIVGRSGIRDAYRTGRGRIVMRARAHIEELRGGKSAIVITELPYGVKKGGDTGVIRKIADLVQDKVLTEISDLADHSDRTGMRIQVELKRDADPAGRAQQALQAHAAAVDVRLQRRRARRRRAADAVAARARHALPRLPARGRHPPLEGRAAQGRGARARPRGLPHRARQHRRDRRADPRRRRHRRGAHAADGAASRSPRSRRRRSSTCGSRASPGSRARRSRRSTRTCRSGSPSCATILGDQAKIDGAHPRGAARDQADLRPQRRPPHRDRRRRGGARARGPDRGRGHGDRDHAVRLHQAATRDRLPRAAARRHRRDGDGAEGRRLHRAPLRRLDARLHPLLHERRQGLPAEGARAAARLAPVEGPRDRQPAAVPPGRAGARRDPDARLRGGEVPRLRDEERRRQEDRARRRTTRRSRPTGSSRSRCATATSSSASATPPATTTSSWSRSSARRSASTRRDARADGPRHLRRAGHAAARRRRGDLDQHRRRTTPTCSS